jgi:hypothetical protein
MLKKRMGTTLWNSLFAHPKLYNRGLMQAVSNGFYCLVNMTKYWLRHQFNFTATKDNSEDQAHLKPVWHICYEYETYCYEHSGCTTAFHTHTHTPLCQKIWFVLHSTQLWDRQLTLTRSLANSQTLVPIYRRRHILLSVWPDTALL